VCCAGGSSLFQSTKERLDRELLEIAPQAAKVKVAVHPSAMERKFAAWLGGSILGCLGSFHQMWMSKQEYEEHGAALIHRKSP
jgi:actin-like protein 6A